MGVGNPRREARDARKQAGFAARQRECKGQLRRIAAQNKAERVACCSVCAGCGARFTDDRWRAIGPAAWDAPRQSYPHLCAGCKQRAITAERRAEQAGREHPEHGLAGAEQKAGGTWLFRLRG
ncbi:hypothetical protein C3492_43420 [Streptomyces sp. Ru62]|uniref:hypothetical protein n=1 Tax=Streptomyces sp. Ru62 TaxID=2080745 RepID=UPI000CDD65E0|nr:hypothetical protein [Streptomyces sp. Ru62]POX57472.1 hypothetical protein C3492_43420 [Streptomyces sp. Ru62]